MIRQNNVSGFEEGGYSETEWALILANEDGLSIEETEERTGITLKQIKKVSAYLGLDWGIRNVNKRRFVKEWKEVTKLLGKL